MNNLAPNSYFGHLVETVLTEVGDNKTPVLLLTFELTHEASSGAWTDITEVKRDVQLYLSDKAKERTFADLRALGFNGDMESPAFTDKDLAEGLELVVENETYQGKTYDRVRIAKLARTERKPAGKDLARQLAAQYRQASSPRPAAPPPPPMQRTTVKEPAAPRPSTAPAGPAAPAVDPDAPPF